jgi:hypothetical protein
MLSFKQRAFRPRSARVLARPPEDHLPLSNWPWDFRFECSFVLVLLTQLLANRGAEDGGHRASIELSSWQLGS